MKHARLSFWKSLKGNFRGRSHKIRQSLKGIKPDIFGGGVTDLYIHKVIMYRWASLVVLR